MKHSEIKSTMESLAPVIKSYVGDALAPLFKRVEDLEKGILTDRIRELESQLKDARAETKGATRDPRAVSLGREKGAKPTTVVDASIVGREVTLKFEGGESWSCTLPVRQ